MSKKPYSGRVGGNEPKARATAKQMELIETLAKRAGQHSSQAIKAVLGKNPIGGLSRERASRVIDALKGGD